MHPSRPDFSQWARDRLKLVRDHLYATIPGMFDTSAQRLQRTSEVLERSHTPLREAQERTWCHRDEPDQPIS